MVMNDAQLAYRVRILRGQGMDPERRYYFPITGYNYRLTNLACAILCAELERAEQLVARRREIFAGYNKLLNGVSGIGFQPVASWAEISPWLYCITVDEAAFGHSREDLAAFLLERNVETRPFFIPLHTLPPFRDSRIARQGLPVTLTLGAQGLNLPTFPSLSEFDIEYVAELIAEYSRR